MDCLNTPSWISLYDSYTTNYFSTNHIDYAADQNEDILSTYYHPMAKYYLTRDNDRIGWGKQEGDYKKNQNTAQQRVIKYHK